MWPLAVYFAATVFITAAIIVISHFLGPRHDEPATGDPYEGGIVSQGSARLRISAKFYLIAMFFVIYDLEAVFIYSWAVAGPDAGWWGYWELLVFAGVLIATLGYLWRIGALDWAHARWRRR